MKFNETQKIMQNLRASYYIDNRPETVEVWHTHLLPYSYELVHDAVMDYIANERRTPTIADIIDRIKAVQSARRLMPNPNARTVSCPHCKDSGLIHKLTETGVLNGEPCRECSRGRERFPWEFMTPEEQQAYRESEAKKGRIIPIYHVASDEFYEEYTGLKLR